MLIKKSRIRAKSLLQKSAKPAGNRLILLTLSLTVIGLIAITDASAPLAISNFSDKYFFVKQQALWALVGLVLLVIFSRIHYSFWEKIATPLFFVSIVGLLLVFIPGLSTKVLGARRWISVGLFTVQPSEFVKLTLSIYIAKVASKGKTIGAYFLPVLLTGGLIMLQPDLGTTMVIVTSSLIQMFVSGINLLHFLTASAVGLLGSLVLMLTSDYRRQRLLTLLRLTSDPQNTGYHIRQILLALGSGGLFGVGLGGSRQKYLFLPETATDSIFAVIAEEIGSGSSISVGVASDFLTWYFGRPQ